MKLPLGLSQIALGKLRGAACRGEAARPPISTAW